MERFYDLAFKLSVELHSQEHAYNVEENIIDKLHAMRQSGGRIQELHLTFSSAPSVQQDLCIGTGWMTQLFGTLTLSLEGRCFWNEDLWQHLNQCQNLTRVNLVGDSYCTRGYLNRLRLRQPGTSSELQGLIRIESSSLEELRIELYDRKLALVTPNLRVLEVGLHPQADERRLFVLSAPLLEVYNVTEREDPNLSSCLNQLNQLAL